MILGSVTADITFSNTASIISSVGSSISSAHNSSIIGGNNITLTRPNTVAVPAISFANENTPWVMKEIEIGDWDMDTLDSVTVSHLLSATEWKTIRDVSCMIRDDLDIDLGTLISSNTSGVTNGSILGVDSTTILLNRVIGGGYDNTSYTTTTFNRGFITFWYSPDTSL